MISIIIGAQSTVLQRWMGNLIPPNRITEKKAMVQQWVQDIGPESSIALQPLRDLRLQPLRDLRKNNLTIRTIISKKMQTR